MTMYKSLMLSGVERSRLARLAERPKMRHLSLKKSCWPVNVASMSNVEVPTFSVEVELEIDGTL